MSWCFNSGTSTWMRRTSSVVSLSSELVASLKAPYPQGIPTEEEIATGTITNDGVRHDVGPYVQGRTL
jgi:hypothetical protein